MNFYDPLRHIIFKEHKLRHEMNFIERIYQEFLIYWKLLARPGVTFIFDSRRCGIRSEDPQLPTAGLTTWWARCTDNAAGGAMYSYRVRPLWPERIRWQAALVGLELGVADAPHPRVDQLVSGDTCQFYRSTDPPAPRTFKDGCKNIPFYKGSHNDPTAHLRRLVEHSLHIYDIELCNYLHSTVCLGSTYNLSLD